MVLTLTLDTPIQVVAKSIQHTTNHHKQLITKHNCTKRSKSNKTGVAKVNTSKHVTKPSSTTGKQHDIDTYITQTSTTNVLHTIQCIIDTAYTLYNRHGGIVDINRLPLKYILDAYDLVVKHTANDMIIYNILLSMSADTTVMNWYDKYNMLQTAAHNNYNYLHELANQYTNGYSDKNNAVLYDSQYQTLQSDIADVLYTNLLHNHSNNIQYKQIESVDMKQNEEVTPSYNTELKTLFDAWYTIYHTKSVSQRNAAKNLLTAQQYHTHTIIHVCYKKWRSTYRSNIHIRTCKKQADKLYTKHIKQTVFTVWSAMLHRYRITDQLCVEQDNICNLNIMKLCFRHWTRKSQYYLVEKQLLNKAVLYRGKQLQHNALQCFQHMSNKFKQHKLQINQYKSMKQMQQQRLLHHTYDRWKLCLIQIKQFNILRGTCQLTANTQLLRNTLIQWNYVTHKIKQLTPLFNVYTQQYNMKLLRQCYVLWLHDKQRKMKVTQLSQQHGTILRQRYCINIFKQYTNRRKYIHAVVEQQYHNKQWQLMYTTFYELRNSCKQQKSQRQQLAIQNSYNDLLNSTCELFQVKLTLKQSFQCWRLVFAHRMYMQYKIRAIQHLHHINIQRNVWNEWITVYRIHQYYKQQQKKYAVRQWLQYNQHNQSLSQLHDALMQVHCIRQWHQYIVQHKKIRFMNQLISVNALKNNVIQHKLNELHMVVANNLCEYNISKTSFRQLCVTYKQYQYSMVLHDIAQKQYQHSVSKRLLNIFKYNSYTLYHIDTATSALHQYQLQHHTMTAIHIFWYNASMKLYNMQLQVIQQDYHQRIIQRHVFIFWKQKYQLLSTMRHTIIISNQYYVLQQWKLYKSQHTHNVDTMTQLAIQRNNSLLLSQAYNHMKYTHRLHCKVDKLRQYIEYVWLQWLKQHCFYKLQSCVNKHKQRQQQIKQFMFSSLIYQKRHCMHIWYQSTQTQCQYTMKIHQFHTMSVIRSQHNAIQQWYAHTHYNKSIRYSYDTVKAEHNKTIQFHVIRAIKLYLQRYQTAYKFSHRHDIHQLQNVWDRWINSFGRINQLNVRCDTLLNQNNMRYKRHVVYYWLHVKHYKLQQQHKLIIFASTCTNILARQILAHWSTYTAVNTLQHRHSLIDARQLMIGTFVLWCDEMKQKQLDQTADVYCAKQNIGSAIRSMQRNVQHNKTNSTRQLQLQKLIGRIVVQHKFAQWKQYMFYVHNIDLVAQQYHDNKQKVQFINVLSQLIQHKQNESAITVHINSVLVQQSYNIWLHQAQHKLQQNRADRTKHWFTMWRINTRYSTYTTNQQIMIQHKYMKQWLQQYKVISRAQIIIEYSEQIDSLKLMQQSMHLWSHEYKQQYKINHAVQRQQLLTYKRIKHSTIHQLYNYMRYRRNQNAQQIKAITFNTTVLLNRAKYHLLVWNYEYKYKYVIQKLYNDAIVYYTHRNQPQLHSALNHWIQQYQMDRIQQYNQQQIQNKLSRQIYTYYFNEWLLHYRYLQQQRDIVLFTRQLQHHIVHNGFYAWKYCLYNKLQDEKQMKQLQIKLYQRTTPIALTTRIKIVQQLFRLHTQCDHRNSIQSFCVHQLKRYLQYRRQQQFLYAQAELHYINLLEKHTFTIWQYKIYQTNQSRKLRLYQLKYCYKRGIHSFITNVVQRQLYAKHIELSVQYWRYHTIKHIFNIMTCIYHNKTMITRKFHNLLLQRYYRALRQQYEYRQLIKQQESLCNQHYTTKLAGVVLRHWRQQTDVILTHINTVETSIGFVELRLNQYKTRIIYNQWIALTRHRIQRHQHCDAIEFIVETIWIKNVFLTWKRIVNEIKQRNTRYLLSQMFYNWKYQCQSRTQMNVIQ